MLAFAVAALAPGGGAAAFDVEGTWHVLAHYTDANTSRPGQLRWDDRIWVFERRGSKLSWIEYPIVVFSDESGRFERRSTGQYARVVGAWQPDEGQLANIDAGLKINTRGAKKKSLRGSDAAGWSTSGRARAGSASVVTYQESWSVGGLGEGLPVFSQEDQLGSGRSESLDGVTRYTTTALEDDGRVLRGRFDRDGSRLGTFVMRRSGAVGQLEKRSQSEIQARAQRRSLQTSQEARRMVRENLAEVLEESGFLLSDDQIDEIATRAIDYYIDGLQGERLDEEIRKTIRAVQYDWLPQDSEHDEGARYRLPFRSEAPRRLLIGPRGEVRVGGMGVFYRSRSLTQQGKYRQVHVFKMPVGSEVVAARAGRVVQAIDGYHLSVLHDDGSYAAYWPVGSFRVKIGERVAAGDSLAETTALDRPGVHSDVGSEPQLDFGVFVADGDADARSVPIRFEDGSPAGLSLVTGLYYGGEQRVKQGE